ncbi:hypothetical protein [Flindersiella endophytica]
MSNNYDSMAGAFSSGKTLGTTAFVSSLVACSVWPELLLPIPADKSGIFMKQVLGRIANLERLQKSVSIAGQSTALGGMLLSVPMRLKLVVTDTGAMLHACGRIHESGQTARDYLDALNKSYYSITPDVWQANDQKAFSERLRKYRDSVVNTCCLCEEIAMITSVIGTLRFVQHAICAALATAMAVMAAAFWVAMAIPFGQGVATAIRNIGTTLAKILRKTVQLMDEIMVKVGLVGASLVAARSAQAVLSDAYRLGDDAMGDAGNALKQTLGDVWDKLKDKKLAFLTGW